MFSTSKPNCDTVTSIPASASCPPDYDFIGVGMKKGLRQRSGELKLGMEIFVFCSPDPSLTPTKEREPGSDEKREKYPGTWTIC